MIEHTARAAAICAQEGTIEEILAVTYRDRLIAEAIGLGDYWWSCFWDEFSYIREK